MLKVLGALPLLRLGHGAVAARSVNCRGIDGAGSSSTGACAQRLRWSLPRSVGHLKHTSQHLLSRRGTSAAPAMPPAAAAPAATPPPISAMPGADGAGPWLRLCARSSSSSPSPAPPHADIAADEQRRLNIGRSECAFCLRFIVTAASSSSAIATRWRVVADIAFTPLATATVLADASVHTHSGGGNNCLIVRPWRHWLRDNTATSISRVRAGSERLPAQTAG